ncbi:hypothetical protein [Oricola sp.]|uniref:tetratricopeptide repeat protein n=1 Tax=Oricola sp. TaxID=1979950 RepID=UPI0025CD7880|nr:hypothetical protein [Oricola sp.]MCI5076858.1 hypothetical protein [Oricola sp.]
MTQTDAARIQPPTDEKVFQQCTAILFGEIYQDPNAQEWGTKGQKQDGIDVIAREKTPTGERRIGIQCKQKEFGKKVSEPEFETDFTSALGLDPAIDVFILVSTAKNDASLQAYASKLALAQQKAGREIEAHYWGWETLSARIIEHDRAIRAFDPDNKLLSVLDGQDQIQAKLDTISNDAGQHNLAILTAIQEGFANLSAPTADSQSLKTEIDGQIDGLRDLINDGRPRTALMLLEQLAERNDGKLDGRLRFRLHANLAACHMLLDDLDNAIKHHLEAYASQSETPDGIASQIHAFLLKNDFDEAWKIANQSFPKHIANERLAVMYWLAAANKEVSEEDLVESADEIPDNDNIAAAKCMYFIRTADSKRWWRYAHDGSAKFSDNQALRRFSAEATVDQIAHEIQTTEHCSADQRAALEGAVEVLNRQLDHDIASENSWDGGRATMAHNLVVGLRLLGNLTDAKKVLDQALAALPEHPALQSAAFYIALTEDDVESAEKFAPAIGSERDRIFGLVQVFLNKDRWADVLTLLASADLSAFENSEQVALEGMCLLAEAHTGGADAASEKMGDLVGANPDNMELLHSALNLARVVGHFEHLEEIYQALIDHIEGMHSASRIMLAREAASRGDHQTIIAALKDITAPDTPSSELRLLLQAYTYIKLDETELAFYTSACDALGDDPAYSDLLAAIAYNIRDLPRAIEIAKQSLAHDPTNADTILMQIGALRRNGQDDGAIELLAGIDLGKLTGKPTSLITLARMRAQRLQDKAALETAYRIAQVNAKNFDVMLSLSAMLIHDHSVPDDVLSAEDVKIDFQVKIEGPDKAIQEFILEADPNSSIPNHYPPDHHYYGQLLGAELGSSVEVQDSAGNKETWTVRSVRHKYLALNDAFLGNLGRDFGPQNAIRPVQIENNDMQPLLDSVRTRSEHIERIDNEYYKGHLPLSMASEFGGGSCIEYAGHLIAEGQGIRTCLGNIEEREQALQTLRENSATGAIFDTYTAWTVAELGIADQLRQILGSLIICQTTIDELVHLLEIVRNEAGHGEQLSLSYQDGRYLRVQTSADELNARVARIEGNLAYIQQHFTAEPFVLPTMDDSEIAAVFEELDESALGPFTVAKRHGLLFVSEDLGSRQLFRVLDPENARSAWLQAILMYGHETGVLSLTDYAMDSAKLAQIRHGHISLSPDVLAAIAEGGIPEKSVLFDAALTFLGNETADFGSHFRVALAFLRLAWRLEIERIEKMKYSGRVLERLYRMLSSHHKIAQGTELLRIRLYSTPQASSYLEDWLRGHFYLI